MSTLCWESIVPFLFLVSFARVSLLASGDNRRKFVIKVLFCYMLRVAPKLLELKKMHRLLLLNFSVTGCNRSNMVSSTFSREFNGRYSFLFGNCYHGDEVFDSAFDNVTTF